MSSLPREVFKWIQSLDLTYQIKIPKWDLSNGYLIAEIFSWYYPQDICLRMFMCGESYQIKQINWHSLRKVYNLLKKSAGLTLQKQVQSLDKFIKKKKLPIPTELVTGTIHCWEEAAAMLVQRMYEILTKRTVRSVKNPERKVDFTDASYQLKLPPLCRTTAARSIHNNTKITEYEGDGWHSFTSDKAINILAAHYKHRIAYRKQDPARYNIVPTLGERALRREPKVGSGSHKNKQLDRTDEIERTHSLDDHDVTLRQSVHFQQINVKQAERGQAAKVF